MENPKRSQKINAAKYIDKVFHWVASLIFLSLDSTLTI